MKYNFALCNFLSETPTDIFVIQYFLSLGCKIVSPQIADFLICDVNHFSPNVDVSKYPKLPKLLLSGENLVVWYSKGSNDYNIIYKNIVEEISKYNYAFITNSDILVPGTKITYMPYAMQAYDLETAIENRKSPLLIKKEKFCCFCVKNASTMWKGCSYRDEFFHELSKYKKVDSLGPHLNNVGGPIPREGFEEYMSKYKFAIFFENSADEGYITEKLMKCFVAGVVGLYWGHKSIFQLVNKKSFIFVDMEEKDGMKKAIERIKYLDEHEEEYLQMLYEEPILTYETFDRKRIHKECDNFLLEYQEKIEENRIASQIKELQSQVPKQLPGTERIKFVLQINNCKKYASRRAMQTRTWCKDIPDDIVWYHVIGDPTLKECVYKPEEHLLIVPAGDSYECLPQKVYQSYNFAYLNFPSAHHLVKTDDDAIVNISKLLSVIEENKEKDYFGGLVHHNGGKNFYGYDIVQDKSKLPVDGIDTPKLNYIVGGVICISMPALKLLSSRKEIFDKHIYEDLFVAEAIADEFKPQHIKLFSNEFDFNVPVFIVDRVNVSVPRFFDRYDYYYTLFCKPQKFCLQFDTSEEARIQKMRILFPNCDVFDYIFGVIDNSNIEEKKYTGVLKIASKLLINFVDLQSFLLAHSCKFDSYETKYASYISGVIHSPTEEKITAVEKLDDSSFLQEISLREDNIFHFAHSGIFSTAKGLPGLSVCDKLFSYSPFYSSYYSSKIYSETKNFQLSLNLACRSLNLLTSNENEHAVDLIYTHIIQICAKFGSHELLVHFFREALTKGVSNLSIHYEHFMSGFQVHSPNKKEIMNSAMHVLDCCPRNNPNMKNIVWPNLPRFISAFPSKVCSLTNMPQIPKEFTYSSLSISFSPAYNTINNKYIGILRTHSYKVVEGNYISNCEDTIIRTVNYYLEIDEKLNVTSSKEIKLLDKKPFSPPVIGLEDCRYFKIGSSSTSNSLENEKTKEYILGVSYEHIHNMERTMVYYELNSEKEGKVPVIMKTPQFCEKNWLPIPNIISENPKFIYSISPTKLVELNGKKKGIRTLFAQKENFDDERGSTMIEFTWRNIKGFLVLTHRVIYHKNRIYFNRFFFMDSDYKIIAKSNYFYFLHVGIEYCIGCCYGFGVDEGQMLFGVSKDDKETFVVKLSIWDICNELRNTESSSEKDSQLGFICE